MQLDAESRAERAARAMRFRDCDSAVPFRAPRVVQRRLARVPVTHIRLVEAMPFKTDPAWTPSTYRRALALWQAIAPKDDGGIFEEVAASESPRHSSLAHVLAPLLQFRSPPSEEATTNWTLIAANDCPADFDGEAVHEFTPSLPYIIRQVREGPIVRAPHGPIAQIGSLRFATTYRHSGDAVREFAWFRGPDGKVIPGTVALPCGAMIGQRERQRGTKGASVVGASGAAVAAILGLPLPVYKKAGVCRSGRNIPVEESAQTLAAAYANTSTLPPVQKCAPGMASGNSDLTAGFWCLRRVRKMPAQIGWTDTFAEASSWRAVVAAVPDETRSVLAAARTAKNFEEIGNAYGYSGDYARKAGKRILIAANENFAEIQKKMTA